MFVLFPKKFWLFVVQPSESQCVTFVLAQLKDLVWPHFQRFLPVTKQRFSPKNFFIKRPVWVSVLSYELVWKFSQNQHLFGEDSDYSDTEPDFDLEENEEIEIEESQETEDYEAY